MTIYIKGILMSVCLHFFNCTHIVYYEYTSSHQTDYSTAHTHVHAHTFTLLFSLLTTSRKLNSLTHFISMRISNNI